MLQVVPVNNAPTRTLFVNFPYQLYKNDLHWVPPLKMERRDMLNSKKNPFFHHAEVALFLAIDKGKAVGRISAHIDRLYNEYHPEDKAGHFGFFDCVNNIEVARALFIAAEGWLKEKKTEHVYGPVSFTMNEEVGVLIQGFDFPPYPYMNHNFPYYDQLIMESGFDKAKDLFAWSYSAERPIPDPALQIAEAVKKFPGLIIREVKPHKMNDEIRIISDVFNSAWSKNWGFVPWTDAEMVKAAKDLKMILEPKLALIAEVEGKPAAISIALPNYYSLIKDLNGRLFPLGFLKLLYRLKTRKYKTARLCLLGIKKEFRGDILGGLSVLLYVEMHRRGASIGLTGGELSWTLEDNEKINTGIQMMGGTVYKKYRVYKKTLG